MKDDELELWKRYRGGDDTAREDLILYYLPLVRFFVGSLSRIVYWADREDLMQEGIIGLMQAVEKFDPDSGSEFRAYARKYIRGAIFRNPEVTRDMTRHQYEIYRKVKDVYSILMQQLEREPTFEEIVKETGFSLEQVMKAFDAASIAFAEGFNDHNLESRSSEETVERQDQIIMVNAALSQLSKKEVLILTEHYWADKSDREIAEELGMKEDSVKKARKRARKKLRELL